MEVISLILCLYITNAAGSYFHGHPLHEIESAGLKGLSQPHVAKRQANSDQEEVCYNTQIQVICTKGLYGEYAIVLAQCSEYRPTALLLQGSCSENSMGTICATIAERETDTDRIEDACDNSTICSNECRALLNEHRTQLGCCVNAYNSTYPASAKPFIYSYSLWSLCGVEPITEQCTPNFDLPDSHTCNQQEMQEVQNQVYSRAFCNREILEATSNALNAEGCDSGFNLDDTSEFECLADEQGNYCSARDDLDDLANRASDDCRNTDNCDPTCIETLNDIISIAGCCLLSDTLVYNYPRWLSDGFFQSCGVSSPGFCTQQFVSAAGIPKAFGVTIAFAIALVSVIKLY